MSLSTYMRLCLTHPRDGYYKTRDPLGPAGDFITAPEVSQMFGELVGAWALMHWHVLGKPTAFDLVELGPGRGTLMADALRVFEKDPEAKAALSVVLLETSPALIKLQRDKLADYSPRWIHEISELSGAGKPLIVIANEFFDALPVHQYLRDGQVWRERMIGLQDGELSWGLAGARPLGRVARDVDWVEHSPLTDVILDQIAARLASQTGAALIADYGFTAGNRPPGPTLQALRRHQPTDPLSTPGQADLTWLPDFDRIRERLGPGTQVTEQGAFLARLGIGRRAAELARANPERANALADDLERLTDPGQMGTLFKIATTICGGLAANTLEE